MTREKILDFLKRKQDYVSGDLIAGRLAITRQALWKHIQELKDSGYDIVAVPHLGYKLVSCPDRLFPHEISSHLDTRLIGKKIYYFDVLPSTMDTAMGLGTKGAPEGTLVVAETQTKGKGRLGRVWFSPKYKGVYLSLILRPDILPNQAPVLTLLSAVAVCEAIKEVCRLDTQIKWPNDIFLNNKKIGGILTEMAAETDRVSFVIVGIGLNVNNDKKLLISGASSLKEEKGEPVNRLQLLQELLRRLESNYSLFRKKETVRILDKWREYSMTLNKRVKVYSHKEHIEGQAQDVDADGGLLVRVDSGITKKVMAGDVVHCR
ncbi:MAG: biotin--[acetyl-CoA-carboxylase] ligase [Candidatus Omnitrophota bacterium]|nr:biotin--[acetyl-CoA-carboxylase] ligase [Candidatus Omnitrophota bacterium]